MLQNQFNNTIAPNNSSPQILPTQSLYLPNNSYSQTNTRLPENITKENRLDLANSQNQRVASNAQNAELKQSAQNPLNSFVGSNDSINKSAFVSGRTSKYNNKYSFKRHSVANKTKLSSAVEYVEISNDANATIKKSQDLTINNQLAQYKALVIQQEAALKKIRDFAFNRRNQERRSQFTTENVRNINDLTEVYNLTIVGNNSNLKFLQFIVQNKVQTIQNNSVVQKVNSIPQANLVNYSQVNVQRPNTQIIQVLPQQVNIVNAPRPVTYAPVTEVNIVKETTTTTKLVQNNPITVEKKTQPVSSVQTKQIYQSSSSYRYESKPNVQIPKQTGYGYQSFNYQSKYNKQEYQAPKNQFYQVSNTNYNAPYTSNDNTMNLPFNNTDSFNQSSQLYTVQIRELRNKIELLEEQKLSLIDKIRIYQKGNGFSNLNNQETIQIYREEINTLKIQIAQLTELYNSNNGHHQKDDSEVQNLKQSVSYLTETVKQYEEQLIQAQNHIIFLQNSRNTDDNAANLESQVKYLRDTIAKYTEHIEQLDIDRQKYQQQLQQRQQDNNTLLQQVQESRTYIENLQTHLQKIKNNSNDSNGVSYQIYNNLVAQYGRKTLQSIILLQQINRLNYRHSEIQNHLEKAQEYIIRLQESFQTQNQNTVVQHHSQLTKANLDNEQLIQKINELEESLSNPSKIQKVGQASTESFMNHQEYEKLLQVLKDRQNQSRLLSEQMNRLNQKYTQTREHLEKAEDYIIQLQENQASEGNDTGRSKMFEEELNKLGQKVTQLEHDLASERIHKEGLNQRVVTFTAQYEDMEYRYKAALQSMGLRYDQLLQERNSLTSKLSIVEGRLAQSTNTVSVEEIQHLRLNINQLDQQLVQSRDHLKNAQNYIEENLKSWQQSATYKERHDQQIIFIETIKRDLQITQRQNQQLSARLSHFETLIIELQNLRSQNEKLTIVVREKDNTQVSSSLKQIDQVEQALKNYINLYQQSLIDIKRLQQESHDLKIQSNKVAELQEHLLLAENHIIWQQQKIKALDDFQIKNAELKEHLMKAQQHILYLQDQLQRANQLIKQLQQVILIYRNNEINVTLHKAEEYLQNQSGSKKSI